MFHFLLQRKLPAVGWSENDVENLLRHLSDMDSNMGICAIFGYFGDCGDYGGFCDKGD